MAYLFRWAVTLGSAHVIAGANHIREFVIALIRCKAEQGYKLASQSALANWAMPSIRAVVVPREDSDTEDNTLTTLGDLLGNIRTAAVVLLQPSAQVLP